jgi:hypothetical protein
MGVDLALTERRWFYTARLLPWRLPPGGSNRTADRCRLALIAHQISSDSSHEGFASTLARRREWASSKPIRKAEGNQALWIGRYSGAGLRGRAGHWSGEHFSRLRATADQCARLHRLAPIAAVVAAATIIGGIFVEHPRSPPNAVRDSHERKHQNGT